MTTKFKNREFFAVLPDISESRFDEIKLYDKDGKPTGKTQMVEKKPKIMDREEPPQETARRQARHERNRQKDYIRKRNLEYPDFGEFAAMMYEIVENKIAKGEKLLPLESAWFEKCKAVREKYPKPPQ